MIKVCVITNVKVAGDFFDCKSPNEPAAIFAFDCFSNRLQLLEGALLSQKLVAPPIDEGTIAMKPPLFD